MTTRILVATLVVTCFAGVAIAWQSRDPGGQTRTAVAASGVVTGVVVTDTADPQPVRRATVRLSGTGSTVRVVGTDDHGRFTFDRLPAGPVTLSASKPGFVETFHGSTSPGSGPGVPVAIADGGTTDVTIRLLPGGVITGAIIDGAGHPAAGVTVAAADTRQAGSAAPPPVRVVTDDRGVYRIFGLAPGEYLVSALPQLTPASDGRGGPSSVGVTAVTEADVQRARAGAGPAGGSPAESARPVAYAPVFYPGTTDAAGAATIRVASGEERAGIDMSLTIVALARLAGSLVDGSDRPVTSAAVSLVPKRGDQPSPVDALVASGALAFPRATVSASAFSFTGVAPGQYTLVARTGSGQRGAVVAEAGLPTLWSVTDITIDGTDRNGLSLRLLPGLTVTGRFVFERGGAPTIDPATLNFSLVAIGPIPGVPSTFRAIVGPDGTYRIPSVAPGRYLARVDAPTTTAAARWTLKSAVVNDRDIADRPLVTAADGGDLSGVVVTLTDRAARVSGRLVDVSGRPVTRYSVVVFTQDRSLWLRGARRIRAVRPATDGSFEIAGLPSGDYAIAAVENAEDADLSDVRFLSDVLASAFKVTLTEGESRRQDFRVGG